MQAPHCVIIWSLRGEACWIPSSASEVRPGQEGGWNIVFEQQPANSPGLNKLDLSFFYSLQQAATKVRANHLKIWFLL